MPTSLQMAAGDPELAAAVRRARKLLHRRAVVAAAASVVPVPGLDWAVDAALLSRLIPQINAEFGLTAEQIDQLPLARIGPQGQLGPAEPHQEFNGTVGAQNIDIGLDMSRRPARGRHAAPVNLST